MCVKAHGQRQSGKLQTDSSTPENAVCASHDGDVYHNKAHDHLFMQVKSH